MYNKISSLKKFDTLAFFCPLMLVSIFHFYTSCETLYSSFLEYINDCQTIIKGYPYMEISGDFKDTVFIMQYDKFSITYGRVSAICSTCHNHFATILVRLLIRVSSGSIGRLNASVWRIEVSSVFEWHKRPRHCVRQNVKTRHSWHVAMNNDK